MKVGINRRDARESECNLSEKSSHFFHKLVKKDNNDNILTTFSKTSSGTFRVTLATLRADE